MMYIYLITHTNTCTYIYIYYLRSLKFTLKHLKRSYMFRSHNHPQGAYIVLCWSYNLKHSVNYFVMLTWCCGSMSCFCVWVVCCLEWTWLWLCVVCCAAWDRLVSAQQAKLNNNNYKNTKLKLLKKEPVSHCTVYDAQS